jgi:hypothetical protein
METTCHRCHQTVLAENCYCPSCGLPQLVCATDSSAGQALSEPWDGVVRDASSIHWKPAMSASLKLAIPVGVLCTLLSPLGMSGLFWMAAAATWTVSLYLRSQKPAWITVGAGARIGLVTGLLGGWLAFAANGGLLFARRYLLHQSSQIDASWKEMIEESQQLTARMGFSNAAQIQSQTASMLTPEGHAGYLTFRLFMYAVFMIAFAVAGGALGARMLGRSRQPEL